MCSLALLPTKPLAAFNQAKVTSIPKSKASSDSRAELLPVTSTVVPVSSLTGIDRLAELHVRRVIERQSKGITPNPKKLSCSDPIFLREAYDRCRKICAQHATTFNLGTSLLTEDRKKAIWAIYAWGQRMDELVDGPNAYFTSSTVLARWEERLEDIFNGCPYDILDAALADTVQTFSLDIQPFKDMIKGMKTDSWKTRYDNFEELELYCYCVAGTVGLSVPILGFSSQSPISTHQSIYKAALCLGIGNQLTNILRDVVEDHALRGRIYLPQDELKKFGLTGKNIFSRKVTEQWREFMKKQIERARSYFNEVEKGAFLLDSTSRWAVWTSLLTYQKILDKIEDNNYDNLTKRACVGRAEKLLTLPLAYAKARELAA